MPQEGRVWKDWGCPIDPLSSCFKTPCPFCDIRRFLFSEGQGCSPSWLVTFHQQCYWDPHVEVKEQWPLLCLLVS